MEPDALVRAYYDALDDHDYDRLEELLAPGFVQRRPDRTFAGRAAFVAFVRDERPVADTTHELESVLTDGGEAAARGSVVEAGGETLFEFADVFELERPDGGGRRIARLETYTR